MTTVVLVPGGWCWRRLVPLPDLPRRLPGTVTPGGDAFVGVAAAARTDPARRFDELAPGHDMMITAPREPARHPS